MPEHASAWAIAAAATPGARHLGDGSPSDDAFAHGRYAHTDGEVVFLGLADGAGSAGRAAEGAAIAVGTARAAARRRMAGALPSTGAGWLMRMSEIAAETIERHSRAAAALLPEAAGPGSFGCTLIVAIIASPWAAVFSVGDSFAVLRRADPGLHLPHLPPYADGQITQTELISEPEAMSSLVIRVVEDSELDAVALASDGLDRAAVVRAGARCLPHAPFLDPLIDGATAADASSDLAAYLLGDPVLAETTDDDRAMLIAVRR